VSIATVLAVLSAENAGAESRLDWATGAGMVLCSELHSVSDQDLIGWVQGYWTGANLYLGGTDLCVERADISALDVSSIRTLIDVQCGPIKDHPIMFAAFNALKGLPTVPGSRAAGCEGESQ
jgi:hypothetical protein